MTAAQLEQVKRLRRRIENWLRKEATPAQLERIARALKLKTD